MATTTTADDGAQTSNDDVNYRGRRTATAEPNPVVGPDGTALDSCTDLANHSPTGLEWGYGGSGPAQLALALLADRYPDSAAVAHYQRFKGDVVTHLDGDNWTLPVGVIDDYLTAEQVADATPSTEISGPHPEITEGEHSGSVFCRCESCGNETISAEVKLHGCPRCEGV